MGLGKFVFTILCLCIATDVSSCLPGYQTDWEEWKHKFGKVYSSTKEENYHLKIWKKNYRYVKEHNEHTDTSFKVELNHLADQLPQRWRLQTIQVVPQDSQVTINSGGDFVYVPSSWDWRQKGVITPVENQGTMGDVSIVAAECVISYGAIKMGKLIGVSEAEIYDCCVKSSVIAANVFKCIHDIGGLCSEADYHKIMGSCRNDTCSSAVQIQGGTTVPSGNEQALMEAVYKMPVFTLVDASSPAFQLYKSGIYSSSSCSTTRLNHALQIVGYGTEQGKDFWICKNSWGTSWGEDGYMMIARNKHNMCGIASDAMYPV